MDAEQKHACTCSGIYHRVRVHQSGKKIASDLQTFLNVFYMRNSSLFKIFFFFSFRLHGTVYNVHQAAGSIKIASYIPEHAHSYFFTYICILLYQVLRSIFLDFGDDLIGKWAPTQISTSRYDRGWRK